MKILLNSADVIGSSMAGPAIRYWEFAKALAKDHDVVLSTPNTPDISPEGFVIQPRSTSSITKEIAQADVLVTQVISCSMAWAAKRHGVKIILDAYDPMPLENIEALKELPISLREYANKQLSSQWNFFFKMADAILCANEEQRSLWIGLLMGLKRLTPAVYDEDSLLKKLIDIVPFGVSSSSPQHSGKGPRQMFNLKSSDKVLLWGGGIWNWFDPITLLKAVKQLNDEGCPVNVVFMGVTHPNPRIPKMKMASDTVQLAKDLDLLDKRVFFIYGWTPYEQRQSFLLDADIGVSTHAEHLETQYAFRTRILDYIWAGLPIIATEGDSFANLIKNKQLGVVVPYGDVQAVADAIKQILFQPETTKQIKENLSKIRPQFYWSMLVKPIARLASDLVAKPKKPFTIHERAQIFKSLFIRYNPISICYAIYLRRMRNRKK